MTNEDGPADEAEAHVGGRRVLRGLPGFVHDEEIGLGDAIKKVTSLMGIKPCGGCNERAKRLNNWAVLARKHR